MRSTIYLLCIVGYLGGMATAQAGEDSDKAVSKGLIRQGNALLDKGDFAQALDKFLDAYNRYPSPKIYFNQAQALHGLGRNVDALLTYRRFLGEAKEAAPELRLEAQSQIADLTGRIGGIEIRSNRKGALVRLDGSEQGTTPLPDFVWAEPGSHDLTLEWQGDKRSTVVATVAGKVSSIEVTFDPMPGKVRLSTNREGAIVRLDDKEVGKTPLADPLTVVPGEHKLIAEWAGERKTEDFTVVEGASTSLVVNFEDKSPIVISLPPSPVSEPRPWYRSRWMWVAGGAVAAAVVTTLVLVYGAHDQYPANTMGTQTVGN